MRGTRITVGDVLSYLASGMSQQQFLADFPQLTNEDILARLAFAAERERRMVSIPVACQRARLGGRLRPYDLAACWRRRSRNREQDEDLQQLSVLYGAPPKVIWIRLGNCSTTDIVRLLSERHGDIGRFLANEEVAFLALA